MKMFLTRLGENVTVIVNGDITQCDLPSGVRSGLSDALARFEEDEMIGSCVSPPMTACARPSASGR